MTNKIRTGFFGGSFNPIHKGHLGLADFILQQGYVDEVWFVVSPKNPLKATADPADARQRLLAVRTALQDHPHTFASDIEFNRPVPSYTVDTLRYAESTFPGREFVLIIGGDNLDLFTQWKDYDYLLQHHDILVYPRTGASNTVPQGWNRVTLLNAPHMDISSTQLRNGEQR
ncbi:MAG: nicotinate (nicotinamide) nucleotide adenylyltransferase [Bacteroidota bacterium]|nr:nicotinate (nicotinamide) nucleotide adenylyltransferase [Bacteroidota bacterium]